MVAGKFYSPINILLTIILSGFYLILSYSLIGFKPEQLWLVVLFNVLYYAHPGSRKVILGFSIFIVYWIVFDYMKAFPNYLYSHVSIEGLYKADKSIFGIHSKNAVLTVNEYFRLHQNVIADVSAGFFYLCWVPVPLAFAAYLFVKNKTLFLEFSLCFLLVNLIGFIMYYIVPAAPPWYVALNSFEFIATTPGNTAGLQRFDDFFQIHLFSGMYAKSSNVFAAMPSLHSAYPVIVLHYGIKSGLKWVNLFFTFVMAGIWWAAVYTSHHYVLDVLAGVACALSGIGVMHRLKLRLWFQKFIAAYLQKII